DTCCLSPPDPHATDTTSIARPARYRWFARKAEMCDVMRSKFRGGCSAAGMCMDKLLVSSVPVRWHRGIHNRGSSRTLSDATSSTVFRRGFEFSVLTVG